VGPFDRKLRYETSPVVTEGHVIPFGVPLGVCMRNRKMHNIRPSGTYTPEVPLGVFDALRKAYK
jgi:hypothetical protein